MVISCRSGGHTCRCLSVAYCFLQTLFTLLPRRLVFSETASAANIRPVLSTKRKQPIVHPRRTQPEPPIIRPVAIFIALVVLCSIYIVVRGFYESNPALTIIVIITTIGIIVGFTLLLVKVVGNLITREFRKEDVQLKQQAAERSQHAKQREEERQRKETELRKRREEERERQAEEERIRQELLQRQETA